MSYDKDERNDLHEVYAPISWRMFFYVIITYSLVGAFVVVGQIHSELKESKKDLISYINLLTLEANNMLKGVIRDNTSNEKLLEYLDDLRKYSTIDAIELVDIKKYITYNFPEGEEYPLNTFIREKTFTNTDNEDVYRLKVYVYDSTILASCFNTVMFIILIFITKLVMISGISFYLFFRYLDYPLTKFAERAKNILKQGKISGENSIQVEDPELKDTELDYLTMTYNQMLKDSHEVENKIHQTELIIQELINSSEEPLIGIDEEGYVINWNHAAEKAFDIDENNALGYLFEDLVSDFRNYRDKFEEAKEKNDCVTWIHKEKIDSHTRNFEVKIYPVICKEYIGSYIKMKDNSVSDKFNEIMIESEKLTSTGGLAAGVAHEINNPLGVILQSAQNAFRRLEEHLPANIKVANEIGIEMHQVREYLEKKDVFKYLEEIKISGAEASKIVNNLLQFSRMTTSSKKDSDILQIIEQSLSLVQLDHSMNTENSAMEVKIVHEFANDIPYLYCNPTEMEQVFINILKNAFLALNDYQNNPIIKISVSKDQYFINISIQDNGPGIPKSIRKRILDPFFSTNNILNCSGLGLSVVDTIITKNHKGKFDFLTEEGFGTTFKITLPLEHQGE